MSTDPSHSQSMNRLIDQFARLPGIGRRTAERLAFHVLRSPEAEAMLLARAIGDVKANVRHCSICFNLTEQDPCTVCGDSRRDQRQILVVEEPRDVVSLEQTHSYHGVYHVLLGHLSPLEGVGPADLTAEALVRRVRDLAVDGQGVEIILGTNPNLEGDGTALHIAQQLQDLEGLTVSRLARGLPAGTQLEYANKAVLSDAITSRQVIS